MTRVGPTVTGLIPAHAGKTVGADAGVDASGAHPRSRGENDDDHLHIPSVAGSSPLTRGKRFAQGVEDVVGGLIPAHAGKTQ